MVEWALFWCLISLSYYSCEASYRFESNWESLDTRPLPQWYDDAKIGIFLHWGVYSVPSFGSEWFWSNWKGGGAGSEFMKENYPPNFTYQEFKAEFFDSSRWAEIFKKSGAKYVVLTSKHHDGYAMWPSKYSFSWNSVDIGPGRDIVGELSQAVRAENLTLGLYHSLYEWYNPIYISDRNSNWTKQEFVRNKALPELFELVMNYKPSVLWSDGEWEAPYTYWNATEFLAWLYNDSPVRNEVVTNDRWGMETLCKHGDFYTCLDRFNPGIIQSHKWENAMTIDRSSWGFRRNARLEEIYSIEELIYQLVSTVSCGGNLLMNIGPTKEGMITPIFEERLLQVGQWLSINGEAIYGTRPWIAQNDSLTEGVWYTCKGFGVYVIVLNWPSRNTLILRSVSEIFKDIGTKVVLLGNEKLGYIPWDMTHGITKFVFPDMSLVKSRWAYVLKIRTTWNQEIIDPINIDVH